jgi:hypothetical protein
MTLQSLKGFQDLTLCQNCSCVTRKEYGKGQEAPGSGQDGEKNKNDATVRATGKSRACNTSSGMTSFAAMRRQGRFRTKRGTTRTVDPVAPSAGFVGRVEGGVVAQTHHLGRHLMLPPLQLLLLLPPLLRRPAGAANAVRRCC